MSGLRSVPNPLPLHAAEASPLAHELAQARAHLIRSYEESLGISSTAAVAKVQRSETKDYAEHLLNQPVAQTMWADLDTLAAVNPEWCTSRWQGMVDAASDELLTGHRSAAALESGRLEAFPRARYIALVREFEDGWDPKNGIERLLIDTMAQAFTMKLNWLQRLVALDGVSENDSKEGQQAPPRVTFFHAIEQAAAMVDRFDRMFLRALRQLRDLRRYMPTVVVQHADQINVAEQQINVAKKTSTTKKAKKKRRLR